MAYAKVRVLSERLACALVLDRNRCDQGNHFINLHVDQLAEIFCMPRAYLRTLLRTPD